MYTTDDPTVRYDVAEQVRAHLDQKILKRIPDRTYDAVIEVATDAALREIADILRERAHDVYGPDGQHEAARALLTEADRIAVTE